MLLNGKGDPLIFEANGGFGVGLCPWRRFVEKKWFNQSELYLIQYAELYIDTLTSCVRNNSCRLSILLWIATWARSMIFLWKSICFVALPVMRKKRSSFSVVAWWLNYSRDYNCLINKNRVLSISLHLFPTRRNWSLKRTEDLVKLF